MSNKNLISIDFLVQVINSKYYITKERFTHYFTNKYGFDKNKVEESWKIYSSFPNRITEENHEYILDILNKVIEVHEMFQNSWDKRPKNIEYSYNKDIRKIIYKGKESKDITSVIIDMYDSSDIIVYSDILKRDVEIIANLKMINEINIENSKDTFKIFQGDFFDTFDKYYSDSKSTVIVGMEKDSYKKLLYIKGKGYLKNKNELNYDEGTFTVYKLTLNDYKYMGNIHTDLYLLKD